jgi:hypothetical protein
MHYVTHRSHRIQKYMFGIMFPNTLIMETAPGPFEHEKECVDISRPGWTKTHYKTRRSH